LAGVLSFIPTVGGILSAIPAIAMGFLDSPEKALLIGVLYGAIHFVGSHVLVPLLMKGGVNVPPALTLLAQAVLTVLFGFLGLMIAVPLVAVVIVVIQTAHVAPMERKAPAL
jgi:predicted PurR-regulated permease PerM